MLLLILIHAWNLPLVDEIPGYYLIKSQDRRKILPAYLWILFYIDQIGAHRLLFYLFFPTQLTVIAQHPLPNLVSIRDKTRVAKDNSFPKLVKQVSLTPPPQALVPALPKSGVPFHFPRSSIFMSSELEHKLKLLNGSNEFPLSSPSAKMHMLQSV